MGARACRVAHRLEGFRVTLSAPWGALFFIARKSGGSPCLSPSLSEKRRAPESPLRPFAVLDPCTRLAASFGVSG